MKKTLVIGFLGYWVLGLWVAYADDPNTQTPANPNTATNAAPVVVAQTLFADGSTNTWTQADLQQALGLLNRKYHRDQATEEGRKNWHGKIMGKYFIDGADGKKCIVQLYEDGFAWTNAAVRVAIADPEAAAKAKAAAEARQAAWEAANLPADVAALLQRRRDAANGKAQ